VAAVDKDNHLAFKALLETDNFNIKTMKHSGNGNGTVLHYIAEKVIQGDADIQIFATALDRTRDEDLEQLISAENQSGQTVFSMAMAAQNAPLLLLIAIRCNDLDLAKYAANLDINAFGMKGILNICPEEDMKSQDPKRAELVKFVRDVAFVRLATVNRNMKKSPSGVTSEDGVSALHLALKHELDIEVVQTVIENTKSKYIGSDFFLAVVKNSDIEIIKALMAKTPDINKPNSKGFTAAHWAAKNGNMELLKLLIKDPRFNDLEVTAIANPKGGGASYTFLDFLSYEQKPEIVKVIKEVQEAREAEKEKNLEEKHEAASNRTASILVSSENKPQDLSASSQSSAQQEVKAAPALDPEKVRPRSPSKTAPNRNHNLSAPVIRTAPHLAPDLFSKVKELNPTANNVRPTSPRKEAPIKRMAPPPPPFKSMSQEPAQPKLLTTKETQKAAELSFKNRPNSPHKTAPKKEDKTKLHSSEETPPPHPPLANLSGAPKIGQSSSQETKAVAAVVVKPSAFVGASTNIRTAVPKKAPPPPPTIKVTSVANAHMQRSDVVSK